MKTYGKILCIAIIILLIIPMGSCRRNESPSEVSPSVSPLFSPLPPATEWRTYNNSDLKFSIKYPGNWELIENYMGVITVIFISPMEFEYDSFRENVNIIAHDVSEYNITLEEYNELSVEQIKQTITDVDIKSNEAFTLNGNPAYRVEYTGVQGESTLKWMQIYTIKGNNAYIITLTADIERFDEFAGFTENMINEFILD
jgi:eukaryotic-like serine/threonine-protein kinase